MYEDFTAMIFQEKSTICLHWHKPVHKFDQSHRTAREHIPLFF